jgi:hypothetical protein
MPVHGQLTGCLAATHPSALANTEHPEVLAVSHRKLNAASTQSEYCRQEPDAVGRAALVVRLDSFKQPR